MRSWTIAALLLTACGPTVANGDGSGEVGASDEDSSASDDGGTGQDAPPQPDTIIDQSGAEFRWVCPAGEHCRVEMIDGLSPLPIEASDPDWEGPCADDWGYYRDEDYLDPGVARFFDVQGGCSGGLSFREEWGRYVICEENADCPQVIDPSSGVATTGYVCAAGFCQDARKFNLDELPDGWDMRWLCPGDGPRFVPGVYSTQAMPYEEALDAACPERHEPCDYVPAGCHYPHD